jgi:hypothetical protein
MTEEIANADLRIDHIPAPDASWSRITEFALTFNGYTHYDGNCADLANRSAANFAETGDLPDSLTDLRTCLFFEQRRYHHFGHPPDEEALTYLRALIERIRHKVEAGTLD